jgi:hypothetical protein
VLQNSSNYGRTDFRQSISGNNGIQLQEFNIAHRFVVLCAEGFMYFGQFLFSDEAWFFPLEWNVARNTHANSQWMLFFEKVVGIFSICRKYVP